MTFLDTNILVYASDTTSPFFGEALQVINAAQNGELVACLSPQVLREFFAVRTNPKLFEKPFTASEAAEVVDSYLVPHHLIRLMAPLETTMKRWCDLCRQHDIKAQRIHDTYLVATMLDHQVTHLYTADTKGFEAFSEIVAENPFK